MLRYAVFIASQQRQRHAFNNVATKKMQTRVRHSIRRDKQDELN